MANEPWDVIIVGQGLAGTTLGWHLVEADRRVLIVDAQDPVTSSKIAAGLMTPITGQRMSLSWHHGDFLPKARDFYTHIEKRTGRSFFHDRTAVRLFQTATERHNWKERCDQPAFQAHLISPQPTQLLDPATGDASGGGFAMHATQLDVAAYLDASRTTLTYEPMNLDWQTDVSFGPDTISVQEHTTRHLISCEGYAATRNPYFSWVPFNAAKGDILTVRFHEPMPPQCLHKGLWVAPTTDRQVFKIGATYDRETLDQVPDPDARKKLEHKLNEFINVPYTVLEHFAAVRPIIHESKAFIGMHPTHNRLGYFNGLGSKGSLHAPWFAQCFSNFLVHKTPIPEAIDLRRYY